MKIKNTDIAAHFMQIADFLEMHVDNPYRIKAYKRAAYKIKNLQEEIQGLVYAQRDLTEIPSIGKNIAAQIELIIQTEVFPEVNSYLKTNKTNSTILKMSSKVYKKYFRLNIATRIANYLMQSLEKINGIEEIKIAGELRRQTELVTQLDFILTSIRPEKIRTALLQLPEIVEILQRDKQPLICILRSGMRVSFYIQTKATAIYRYFYQTGSENHLAQLQKLATERGCELTAEGLFKDGKKLSVTTETEIYSTLKLDYIPPELRENTGEIAASAAHTLPNLITLADIKGDLHGHTNETDGRESLQTMIEAAMAKGYEYYAITDHSKRLRITNGLDEKRLLAQIDLINGLNSKLKNFTILKSIEVDILEDGSLDLSNDVLKELDLCVCSIHSKFKLPAETQTERIIRAMDNPYFNILGHATGRLMTSRSPYPLDIERILFAAKERGCFLELNAQPARLDIKDQYCKLAKQIGVKLAISCDAHSTRELELMPFGVAQARRGWLEASDVINTLPLFALQKLLKRV